MRGVFSISIAAVACVQLELGVDSIRAQISSHGSLELWEVTDSTWQLSAPGPGSAWLCLCDTSTNSEGEGRSIAIRWSQWLNGSTQNFSRVHFLTEIPFEADSAIENSEPFPISGWQANSSFIEGSFLHLGQSGSEDSIQWYGSSGPGFESYEALSPIQGSQFPNGLDHWIYWDQPPGSDSALLSIAESGFPDMKISMTNGAHEVPKCVGFTCQFTASHTQDFRFEWSNFGAYQPDTTAPTFVDFQWVEPGVVEIEFSERLIPTDGAAMWANGDVIPMSSASVPPNKRWLLIPLDWEPGTAKTMLLSGFADLNGNLFNDTVIIVPKTIGLTLTSSHVILTELMVDPSPSAGLPEVEWVEILNNSDFFISLDQLRWWDESSPDFHPMIPAMGWNGVMEPGGRFVLSSGMQHVGPENGLQAHIHPWPSLRNDGEGIGVFDAAGIPLDVVFYDPSWWHGSPGGFSVERISATDCSGPSNWSVTSNEHGGTPGQAPPEEWMSLSSPRDSLRIDEMIPTSQHSATVIFNAPLDPMAVLTCSHGGAWVNVEDPQLIQWESTEIPTSHRLHWEMIGIRPCERNTPSFGRFTVDFPIHRFPRLGDVAITEIHHDPHGLGSLQGSFVEIMNVSADTLEIGGLKCNDVTLNQRRILAPSNRLCFDDVTLGKSSGWVRIFSSEHAILDSVQYDACWHRDRQKESKGFSLVRLNPRCAGNSHLNWDSSQGLSGCSYEVVDPAEGLNCPNSKGIPMICGRIDGHPLVYFSHPTDVQSPDWKPITTDEFGSWAARFDLNQLWVFESPETMPQFIETSDSIFSIASMCLVPSDGDQSAPLTLNELQIHTSKGPEPFVEFTHSGTSHVSSTPYVWTSASLPFPSDWIALFEAVEWFIPRSEPWALASCPQRLKSKTGRVLPAQLPSLWNVPGLKWARSPGIPMEINLDSLHSEMLYGQTHVPSLEWVPSAFHLDGGHGGGGAGQWLPSLDSRGATPGESNSWGELPTSSMHQDLPLEVIHDTWYVHGNDPGDFVQIMLRPPLPGRWKIELSAMNASGRVYPLPSVGSPEMMGGQSATIVWDGSFSNGFFAPSGPYLLQAHFRHLEGPSQFLFTHPVHVTSW